MYTTQQLIEDEIGGHARLVEALDDDGGGDDTAVAAACARVITRASAAVDAFLAGRYPVPLSPVPALASEAALVFSCELLFNRRRQAADEKNPYTARAHDFRERLKHIADRKESLDAREKPAFLPGAAITTPSALSGSSL